MNWEIFFKTAATVLVVGAFSCSLLALKRLITTEHSVVEDSLRQIRWKILLVNAMCYGLMFLGTICYVIGLFDDSDWRGVGLIFGSAIMVPIAVLAALTLPSGRDRFLDAWIGLCVSFGSSSRFTFAVIAFGGVVLCTTILAYVW